ncbi:hypothetical protein [Janthinobacterium sp. HLX7-2]|uniref:hypothetical protein n=1 Tax=Janthinobacterium sp. HLX7-2 TaxID=1259331 RepID=UPI003F25B9F8
MKELVTMTLWELRLKLKILDDLPDDTLVTFGSGDLSIHRARELRYPPEKNIPPMVNIEFNEIYKLIPTE